MNPTDRPEAVEPQGDLHAAFVAALQGQPAHQDGAGIVRRVAPWAAHEMADRCVEVVREHDAPEHHPDLIALNGGGEREDWAALAARLIADERRRQVEVEGWTPEHDRAHGHENIVKAGQAYLRNDQRLWPWLGLYWKPKSDVRNLIRAGALALAALDLAPASPGALGLHRAAVAILADRLAEVAALAARPAPDASRALPDGTYTLTIADGHSEVRPAPVVSGEAVERVRAAIAADEAEWRREWRDWCRKSERDPGGAGPSPERMTNLRRARVAVAALGLTVADEGRAEA